MTVRNRDWALVFAIGLVVRFIFLLFHDAPAIENDAELYHGVAVNLQGGEGYSLGGEPFGGREPGYILVLSGLFTVFGIDRITIHLVQALLGAVTAVVTYEIARRVGGRLIGLLAGTALALWPTHFGYTDAILTEVLATFFTALIILGVFLVHDRPRTINIIFLAIVAAAASLTRANYLALVLLFPVFFRVLGWEWKRAISTAFITIILALGLYSPWVIRNVLAFDAFVPTRTGAGDIVWSGNYPPWDGNFLGYIPPLTDLKEGLAPVQADRKLYREAIDNIVNSPIQVLGTWAQKPLRVWGITDLSLYSAPPLESRDWRTVAALAQQGIWLLVVVLSGVGGVAWWRRSGPVRVLGLVIILSTLTYLPLNAVARYQVPFLPALFPLSALGLAMVFSKFGWFKRSIATTTAAS